jgi:predicted esterase
MRHGSRLATLLVAGALVAGRAAAQDAPAQPTTRLQFTPGVVTERVTATATPSETYALFVPSTYTAERRWPVLFLMDPRGRALAPLSLFKDAAERFGYLLLSSYNTVSDGAAEPNVRALDAMLQEAQEHFAVDERRIYLAGFSGTARMSWQFAVQLRDNVAGVIGVGAGLPTPLLLLELARLGPRPFVFFGTSGLTDFNYEEVRALDGLLDALPVRNHVEYFRGAHEWPPPEIGARALEWMELQAMRVGLRPRDDRWIDSLHAVRLAEARALEEGRPHEAWLAYQRVRDDFRDVRDVSEPSKKVEQLGRHRGVRRVNDALRTHAARDSAYQEKLVTFLRGVRETREPPAASAIDRALELESLKREASRTDDSLRSLAATRLLERAFVFLAFYEPREYFAADDQPRAIALLNAARRIKPEHAQVCFSLARAHTEIGQNAEALDALECAVKSSAIGADQLAREPTLAGLRSEARFVAMVERLRAGGRP